MPLRNSCDGGDDGGGDGDRGNNDDGDGDGDGVGDSDRGHDDDDGDRNDGIEDYILEDGDNGFGHNLKSLPSQMGLRKFCLVV
jgi:hypothetical protein